MSELDEMFEDQPKAPTTNLLAPVESDVIMLDENADADTILQTYETVKFYLQELKRLKAMIETVMMGKIKATGPLVISPTVRYVVTTPRKTICTNVPGAIMALLETNGGDFDKLCEFLASQPIKHGAASKSLSSEDYAKFFKVEYLEKLTEKKSEKELVKIDDRFIR